MAGLEILEKSQRVLELEEELSRAQQERDNNQAAAQILTKMMAEGEVEQDEEGNVSVSKRRPDFPNVIGNLDSL